MWSRLMDEQEVCGLGVDLCACAERMEKRRRLNLSLSLFFFFSSLSNHRACVCVCEWSRTCVRTTSLHGCVYLSACVRSYFDAGTCRTRAKPNGRCRNQRGDALSIR